ncbi:nucleotide-binding universal stress UspA family protein [Hymenobacter luteus]|uniref:Nucleotide-binding universal stress UspA family protein n=2 Tax=Hymenobacter TaxID=89966 RepID=A0A7W9T3U7_9BACT|nr:MULTISPECIES: universal stress protein [Hymenobacter]MBB4603100.1 nucleotide-binding universal stress UspA family protein [Hymenobacter latericoloratus]MBB6060941.1 nucleotide-binding universal stress UspA family protein [Hymenobacter luteus]
MKNILVPTDFSPTAHHAFEVALQMAQRTGGNLSLLHVVDLPETARFATTGGLAGGGGLNNVYTLKLLQVVKHRMHELIAEAARTAPGVLVRDVVHTADFEEAMLETIAERQIDLVVMGAKEHSSWEQFFSGSRTEHMVRRAPCPVLTVKHPTPHFEVRHIVFASDFSSEADLAVRSLRQVQEIFPEALLHLLDVVPDAGQRAAATMRIHRFADRHQPTHYEPDVFDAPNASTGIPRFAEQAHADLVVMLTHGRTGIGHLLQGSISENVALHAAPPVLTLHAH